MAKSNVELVIRARNEASQALRTISDAIKDVIGDQRELADQAGSTESRLSELGRELGELNTNFKQLRNAGQLANDLSRAEQALRKQTDTTMAAQREVNELAYAYERTENPTKRMTNQLAAADRRLTRARDKTEELRNRVATLAQEYDASRAAAGAFGADQAELATLTQRAAAEFTELQTRLRETRNLSKGALSETLGEVDAGNLGAVSAALTQVEQRMTELGEASDLTGVDLKQVAAEIDQLEAAATDLGDLRQLAETFGVMRRESRELLRAFNESQQRTEQLAREFKNAAAPSRELGEALGRSRAETSRLANDYQVASTNVRTLGTALREAGVDTGSLGNAQANLDARMEEVAQTVAQSRVELDRLGDAQKVQAREAVESARLRAEAEETARKAAAEAAAFEEERQQRLDANRRAEYQKWWQAELQKRDEAAETAQREIALAEKTAAEREQAAEEAYQAYLQAEERKRQQAEETARQEAKFAAERQANLRRVQEGEYGQWWEGALQEREAQRANAQQVAESSRVYQQAGAAVEEASTAYRNAAAQVERAGDAHQQASARVARLRDEQAQVAARVEESSAAYADARQRLAGFAQQLEKTNAPSAQLVEQFEEAQSEVKRLGNELKASERELKTYEQSIRSAEGALSGIADEQQRARERASALEASFGEVRAAYEALGTTLRDNGNDTDAVAAAQQRLMAALDGSANALTKNGSSAERAERRITELATKSERAESSLRQLSTAASDTDRGMDRMAASVQRAEANLADFRDQGRTTLSLMQRIRGQVLALTSAYVGLYGVGSGIRGIIDANLGLEAAQSRLRVAVGDSNQAVGEELEYVKSVAEELKLEFRPLTEAYSRYAVAARTAGATGNETRAVFLGLAKAARVNKLSGDQLTRAFRAVEQIFSQGKVQAEELREQLADAGLAGVMNILADSLGVTGEELDKMLEQGQVGSKALIPLAAELEKVYGPGLSAAVETTSASIADLRNQVYEIQLLIGQSGFLESFAEALERVADELRRPEIRQGLQELGAALGDMMVTMVSWLDHLDEILLGLKLLATAFATQVLINFIASLGRGQQMLSKFITFVTGATGAMRLFIVALGVIGALLAAWSIAEWAAKEFPAFGRHWYRFREMLEMGIQDIRYMFQRMGVYISGIWDNTLASLGAALREWISKDLALLAKVFDGVEWLAGGEGIHFGDAIREAQQDFVNAGQDALSEEQKAALAALEKQHAETAEKIAERWAQVRREMMGVDPNLTPDNQEGQALGGLRIEDLIDDPYGTDWRLGGDGGAGSGSSAAQQLADEMERELDRVQQRLAELSADTLEERLALIRAEFEELVAYLVASGNQAGLNTVNELVGLLEAQERANFLREQAREAEEEINAALQYRRDLMEMIEFYRNDGDVEAEERLRAKLNEVNAELRELIANEIERLRVAGGPGAEAAILALERQRVGLIDLQQEFISAEQINQRFASGATDAFLQVGTELGKVIDGTQSWSDAFRNAGDAFRQFASDFLRQIAQMILQAAILQAITGSPTGGGGGIGGAIAGLFHSGGIVGTSQGGPSRTVSPLWFQNAVRYHEGGIAGLKPGEVPSILQRGEEVLTRDDPRHAMNGGAGSQPSVRIINTFDAGEMVSEGLSTPAGERVIMNFLSRNRQKVKSTLG